MRARFFSILAPTLCAALCACEGVANVDLKYQEGGDAPQGPLQMAKDGGVEGGSIISVPGTPVGMDGFCGCDYTAGHGCCLLPGGGEPMCVEALSMNGCAAKGGMFIGCTHDLPDTDSICCWHYGTGPGGLTALGSSCGGNAKSCSVNEECGGGICQIVTCKGVKVGACNATPVCP